MKQQQTRNGLVINLKINDVRLLKSTQFFLNSINREYKNFFNEIKRKKKVNNGYGLNSDVVFDDPNNEIFKRSPLTIVHSNWGTFRSHFFEMIAKNVIDYSNNESKNNDSIHFEMGLFEKMVFVDAKKYIGIENPSNEIFSELFLKLIKLHRNNSKEIMRIARTIINTDRSELELEFFNISSLNPDNYASKKEIIKNVRMRNSLKLHRTLIFVDNIDLLGKRAWNVVHCLSQLLEINNLFLILGMNYSELSNSSLSERTWEIDNYITSRSYIIEQDYVSLLKSLGFSNNIVETLNRIVSDPIDGKNLSLWELEERMEVNDIVPSLPIYEIYRRFINGVWKNLEVAVDIISPDVINCINMIQQRNKKYTEIIKLAHDKYANIATTEDIDLLFSEFSEIVGIEKKFYNGVYIDENVVQMKKISYKVEQRARENILELIDSLKKLQKKQKSRLKNIEKDFEIKKKNIQAIESKISENRAILKSHLNEMDTLKQNNYYNNNIIISKQNIINSYNQEISRLSQELTISRGEVAKLKYSYEKNNFFKEIDKLINKIELEFEEFDDILSSYFSRSEDNKLVYDTILETADDMSSEVLNNNVKLVENTVESILRINMGNF